MRALTVWDWRWMIEKPVLGLYRLSVRSMHLPMSQPLQHRTIRASISTLFPICPHLTPPPAREIHGSNIDAQILQCLCREVAIIRSLNTGVRVIPLRVRYHAIQRQAHNLRKELAHLIFRVFVFG